METLILKFKNSFFSRPFKVYGTTMTPNLLLMCKILLLMLLAHGFFSYLNDPFIPFIPALDEFHKIPNVFEYVLKFVFGLSSLFLLFNFRVRTMAILLGVTIIITLIASKSVFRNHLFIVGCMFFLSGLSEKNKTPWLLYLQLSLIYFGALTNKMLEIDWWSGQYMHNWLGEALRNGFYIYASDLLPDMLLAKIISYSAMFSELIIAISLLIPKYRSIGVSLVFVFHILMFTLTGETFGFFMENILIILIAFLAWPKDRIIINYRSSKLTSIFKLFSLMDMDRRVNYQHEETLNSKLELKTDTESYKNKIAFSFILLYNTSFFVVIIFVEMLIRYLFDGFTKYLILLFYLWTIILLLSPIVINSIKQERFPKSK